MTLQERFGRCQIRVTLEAARTRQRVLVARRSIGRTTVRTLLRCPCFRSNFHRDTVFLGGTRESFPQTERCRRQFGSCRVHARRKWRDSHLDSARGSAEPPSSTSVEDASREERKRVRIGLLSPVTYRKILSPSHKPGTIGATSRLAPVVRFQRILYSGTTTANGLKSRPSIEGRA